MGIYLNPGNSGFQEVVRSEYVDKTGLINLMNQTIDTKSKLTCISRPRRFGKSYAAQMLCAYYDCSCDSHTLFDDKEIAGTEGYLSHLNQYHVINLDMSAFLSAAQRKGTPLKEVPDMIVTQLLAELEEIYPDCTSGRGFADSLFRCVEKTGKKFVFVIDEWDALIREAKGNAVAQKRYLSLLREWFKSNNFTPKVVAAAYMTGILPIKKDGFQSAISDFSEYSILNPGAFAQYTGFTEEEVRRLCGKYGLDFDEAGKWYDGYEFPGVGAVYNPYSIMCAVRSREFQSYWRKTSAAESLMTYINMDFEGMQEVIARLISGEEIEVDTDSFENDFETFKGRDDVLTLLIHLGYLTWDRMEKTARIPNEEIKAEFRNILKDGHANRRWLELINRSRKLLESTIAGDSDAVAEAIETIRSTQYAPTFYNDEQALRYVIKFAYIAAIDQYLKVEELPSGRGIADVVYLPRRKSMLPAMIVELKWDQSSEGAIGQIKEKDYPAVLRDYGGEIILVGINYNSKTKVHSCRIERYDHEGECK